MQDGEHDALPLPIVGGSAAAGVIASNPVVVATTLAALFLAGSAIVYRNRPHARAGQPASQVGLGESGVELEPENERDAQGDLTGLDNAAGSASELSSKAAPDGETKEGKSLRTKDRRRRGKDPLKEIFKGGKKLRAFSSTTPSGSPHTPYSPTKVTHRSNDDIDSASVTSQASSSTSLLPLKSLSTKDSMDSLQGSLSRKAGKRTGRGIIGSSTFGGVDDAGGLPGTTSAGQLLSASEVSQNDTQNRHQDEFDESFHLPSQPPSTFSHSYAESHVASLPYPNQRHHMQPTYDRPPSSLASASDDGQGAARSMSSTSSRSQSRHTRLGTDEGLDLEGRCSPLPRSDNQAQSGLAEEEVLEDSEAPSSLTTTTTAISPIITSPVVVGIDCALSSPNPDYATLSSASSSVSTDTTNTAPSSSATRATSPTLSQSSGSSKLTPTPGSADSATPRNQTASPSMPSSTITTTPNTKAKSKARKTQQSQTGTEKGKSKASPPNPWGWDGVDVPSSLQAAVTDNAGGSSSKSANDRKEPSKEKETYKKPPRLQSKGSNYSSFSSVASSSGGLTPSTTHPASLYSPTVGNFPSSTSGGVVLSTSVSSAATGGRRPSASLVPPSASLSEDVGISVTTATVDGQEDDVFTYPTLNPASPSIAGPSRIRSSLGDITSPTISTRGKNSRRPSTPSHKSNTTSPTLSSSTNAHISQQPGGAISIPALSAQTQLASLRGALEAARLREEKNKAEMEKYVKEMEMLRWEHATSRRGEAELQAHVRHLMHQLHTYAALFASIQPQSNAQPQPVPPPPSQDNGLANPADSGSSPTSPAPNGQSGVSESSVTPSTPQQQSHAAASSISSTSGTQNQPQAQTPTQVPLPPPLPLQLPMFSAMGMNSPGGILSPMMPPLGMHPGTASPFFPYPMSPQLQGPSLPPPLLLQHMQQLHHMQQYGLHQQSPIAQSPGCPPTHPNFFGQMFQMGPPPPAMMSPQHQLHSPFGLQPPAVMLSASNSASSGAGSVSGPSSVAGTPSTGSMSPDLRSGSSSPGSGSLAMVGEKRQRTRTRMAKGHINGRMGLEVTGDGAIGSEGSAEKVDVEDDEGPANGIAVDSDSEGEFNSLLADAIFKRPGSLRVRSESRKSVKKEHEGSVQSEKAAEKGVEEQLTEFTFPSISDLGNVYYRSSSRAASTDYSRSSSLSSPPPQTPAAVPDSFVNPVVEDKQLPAQPAIEQVEASLREDIALTTSTGVKSPPTQAKELELSITEAPTAGSSMDADLQRVQEENEETKVVATV